MSLNDLFSVSTTVRLSPDMALWADQIITALLSKFPSLSKWVGEVVFAKVDSLKGNAAGYITLINKTQRIPFIVDQMELNALDMYIDNTTYKPLTEHTVVDLDKSEWPLRLLSQPERTMVIKTASLFEDTGELKNSFIQKHREDLAKIAEQFPEVLEQYSNKQEPITITEPLQVKRFFIKEAESNKPIVERNVIDPDKNYKFTEFAEKYGKEFTQKLMTEKNIIWSNIPPRVKLELHESEVSGAYTLGSQDRIGFVKRGVDFVSAKLFDHCRLSKLDKSTTATSVCVITNDGHYLPYSVELYTRAIKDTHFQVNRDLPKIGDMAGLIIGDYFYGPFIVDSIGKIGSDIIYTITDDELKKVNLRYTDHIKSIVKLDESNYLVSKVVQLVPVKLYGPQHQSDKEIVKQAGIKVNVSKQINGNFTINDGGVSGIDTSKMQNLKKMDAIVVLMRCGLTQSDARYALLKALETGTYSFDAVEANKKENKEQDESLTKKASYINELCENSDLLKIAVISGDKSNIDMALGLNLITPHNIKRFRLLVPEIKEMLDRLCKILITKRMNRGLINIDESKLTQAILALDEIAYNLKSL